MENLYDIVVLGLGAMGSSALYQLSKSKLKVLGIDQFNPPHDLGSSHGETRITRKAIGEGDAYVPIVLKSYDIVEELERISGERLFQKTGGLIFGNLANKAIHGKTNFIEKTIDTANRYNIKHRTLNVSELRSKFPQFNYSGDELGYYEEDAGFLRPEKCIETQLKIAKENKAEIIVNTKVNQIIPSNNGSIELVTSSGRLLTNKLILSAGPWITDFIPEYKQKLKVFRQVLYWFDCSKNYSSYSLDAKFPVFVWDFGQGKDIYGFPAIDGVNGGLKVACEQYVLETVASNYNQTITKDEESLMYKEYILNKLINIGPKVVKSKTCLYTNTPDADFVIDFHPKHPQVIIASPCSGHGFKHSFAVGLILSELALSAASSFDISSFSLSRLP